MSRRTQARVSLIRAAWLLAVAPILHAGPIGPSPAKPGGRGVSHAAAAASPTQLPVGAARPQPAAANAERDRLATSVAQALAALRAANAAGPTSAYQDAIGNAVSALEQIRIPEAGPQTTTYLTTSAAIAAAADILSKELPLAEASVDSEVSAAGGQLRNALQYVQQAQKESQAVRSGSASSARSPEATVENAPPPPVPAVPFSLPEYVQPALLGIAVVLLLWLLLRPRRQPKPPVEDISLHEALRELRAGATAAANRIRDLGQNYDQLEAQYEQCNQEYEQLRAEYNRQAGELATVNARLTASRANPEFRDGAPLNPAAFLPDPHDNDRPSYPPTPRTEYSRPASALTNQPAEHYEFAVEPPPFFVPPAPATPQQVFGSDPESDYLRALHDPSFQTEFRRVHTPFGVSCRNLGQRSIEGAALLFERDALSRSLFAVSQSTEILIFPGFSIDAGSTRSTLEGIYTYPAEFSELVVATAARAESRGDLYSLTRPGTFRNG